MVDAGGRTDHRPRQGRSSTPPACGPTTCARSTRASTPVRSALPKACTDFADVRNWIYKGKKIDQAVHLGFDLSDVQNAPVTAANDGRMVWADDLGIYGNCVVVDHGYALQSIYGHMRQIDVKVGDMVKKGQKMGIAGADRPRRRSPRPLQSADRRSPD